ncbi:5-(carboxyamino)imidazole ribonucleotide synthase [Brumimicrobium salinarum]|uniref:N5-carboxyaminoimidazole ribonucleotide synthase n=1 Tax=Brumimicrobium salinarum TaxID=2058658 RepID=A0A2I0R0E6_9FLAO|nr:5-(carboxyamino)imidazole ribonucleotide synthase [Brumimicrobium salinarum]PKR80062.1 5-(carboxyamino)imidazole ribonucleotide synthase [Brumimicrobium salinarum]
MRNKWYGEGFKLGVLGGGQLGRMLIQSAINYDVHVYVMDGNESAPCSRFAYEFTKGDIQSYDDVLQFGADKDVLTVEIEHINVDALEALEKQGVKVYPQPHVLRIIQDKGKQKMFYKKHNIPTASFELINNANELSNYANQLPLIQKMRTGGYDGKGVQVLNSSDDLAKSFDAPSLLETKIDFKKELSVIVARNEKGEIKSFPVVECEFNEKLNLVEFLFSPANISMELENKAKLIAEDVIQKLEMTGLLAVELFLTQDNQLLVNEVAPRTHNSGHHTIECNKTSQFEQHLRAIIGLPLGSTAFEIPGVMVNLLGEQGFNGSAYYQGLEQVIEEEGVYVHLYGKEQTKPYRKMGHVTVTNQELEAAKAKARRLQDVIKVISSQE